jgi:hypothetical protein
MDWIVEIDWRHDTGEIVERKLRTQIGKLIDRDAIVKIGFAAFELDRNTTLFDKTATYNDKIYFSFVLPSSDHCDLPIEWLRLFSELWDGIEKDHRAFREICDAFCGNVAVEDQATWNETHWKTIVLLRSLVPVFCDTHIEEHVADVTRKLLAALTKAVEDDCPLAAYHCAFVLEWIAYAYPEVFSEPYGEGIVDLFCEAHLMAANKETWPIMVRYEAIWSLGWASVSMPRVGEIVIPELQVLEQQPEIANSAISWAIVRMAWARGLFRQAYDSATTKDKAGAFSRLLHDRKPKPEEVEAGLRGLIRNLREDS